MKGSIYVSTLALLCFTITSAQAFCFAQASRRYGVDEQLLIAIAKVESNFNPKAIHVNTDLTEDVGLMQINSSLLPALEKHNITRKDLLDPCTSANLGAWVLAQSIRYFGSTWRAVGGYGAGLIPRKEAGRQIYANKVQHALTQVKAGVFTKRLSKIALTEPTFQVSQW